MTAPGLRDRELVFCSDFGLGYANPEAEERMRRFAARGWPVTYAGMVGIRNPRPEHVVRMVRSAISLGGEEGAEPPSPFKAITPKLVPPRHTVATRALNRTLAGRQVFDHLDDPGRAIVWLRFPTPEIVAALDRIEPALVVYEQVDDHRSSMGSTRLRRRFDAAERRVLERAGVVFAWSPPIAERLEALHPGVVLNGPAVDTAVFGRAGDTVSPVPRTAVFVGGIDRRVDAELLARVAATLEDWSFTLAGPVEREAGDLLASPPNIRTPGRVPPSAVPDIYAGSAVCLMPYRVDDFTNTLDPLKRVEYLATGRPVVSTPIAAVLDAEPEVVVAEGPDAFAAAIGDAEDSDELRSRRRAAAAPYEWDRRIDQMEDHLATALKEPS